MAFPVFEVRVLSGPRLMRTNPPVTFLAPHVLAAASEHHVDRHLDPPRPIVPAAYLAMGHFRHGMPFIRQRAPPARRPKHGA